MKKEEYTDFLAELIDIENQRDQKLAEHARQCMKKSQQLIRECQERLARKAKRELTKKTVEVLALPGGILTKMVLFVQDIECADDQKDEGILFAIIDDHGSRFAVTKVLNVS